MKQPLTTAELYIPATSALAFYAAILSLSAWDAYKITVLSISCRAIVDGYLIIKVQAVDAAAFFTIGIHQGFYERNPSVLMRTFIQH